MRKVFSTIVIASLFSFGLSNCSTKKERIYPTNINEVIEQPVIGKTIKPQIKKQEREGQKEVRVKENEMRAVWLTTAYNLDWPLQTISSSADVIRQKKELIEILDQLKEDNYNTVFFQVRTSTGVCYPSEFEPFAPNVISNTYNTDFDPTAFALEECKKRGLSFHAWFITFPMGGGRKAMKNHSRYKELKYYPDFLLRNGNSYYLDPGNPNTAKYLSKIIVEALNKYDFDGVHLDYIRYPDKSANFPDSHSYQKYGASLSLKDWRRNSVTNVVKSIKEAMLKSKRPNAKLSAAPLGKLKQLPIDVVGRKHGFTAYETVMQDPELWAKNGYVDFLVPMLYYRDELFSPFLDDWMKSVSKYCPIVVGLAPYRIITESSPLWSNEDISKQITESREKGADGVAMFRYQFVSNRYPSIRYTIKKEFNKK